LRRLGVMTKRKTETDIKAEKTAGLQVEIRSGINKRPLSRENERGGSSDEKIILKKIEKKKKEDMRETGSEGKKKIQRERETWREY